MGDAKNNIPNDLYRTVNDLRDKFKHGHHIIKILESQLETARQNISLLQGQVRLANETIDNLKQQFSEADLTLSYLTDNSKGNSERLTDSFKHSVRESDVYAQASGLHGQRTDDYESPRNLHGLESRSPKQIVIAKPSDAVDQISDYDTVERPKSSNSQGKPAYSQERPKSPYEQQLRQVLDALQDEDPRRVNISATQESPRDITVISQSQPQLCMCPECVPSSSSSGNSAHQQYQDAASRVPPCSCEFTGTELHYHEDCSKHHPKAIGASTTENSRQISESQRESQSSTRYISGTANVAQSVEYSSRCTGPCCSSVDQPNEYKIVETSSVIPHFITSRSSRHQHQHDANGKIIGHCDDKCRCHAFVNYAPFGYQVVESAPGIAQAIQPISPSIPSKKNKRYHPLFPGDEPPHLKYTKVKRIDESKVAAQRTIQDFSKRRLHPYNPRWDLDMLIVPPPIPASDLISAFAAEQHSDYQVEKGSAVTNPSAEDQEKKKDVGNDSFEAAIVSSKVINSGGTVIVLTEGENVDLARSIVMHSTPKVYPVESSSERAAAILSSYDDKVRLQQDQVKYSFESVNVTTDEKSQGQQIDVKHPVSDNQVSQFPAASITGLQKLHDSASYESPNKSLSSTDQDFNRALVYSSANSDVRFKIPEAGPQNASVITSFPKKIERNNNSFTNSTLSFMLQQQNHTDHTDNNKDLSSNLTARYEEVLFQRNQDFSKLGADEDYVIQNRVKGKVH